MPLRYNDATGEFEESGKTASPPPPSSGNLRYNPETGEFEPIRRRGAGAPRRQLPRQRPTEETRRRTSNERFVQAVRRTERRRRERRQRVLRRLCWIGLVLALAAFVFSGKDLAVGMLFVVFALWIAYGICKGSLWTLLAIAIVAALFFLRSGCA